MNHLPTPMTPEEIAAERAAATAAIAKTGRRKRLLKRTAFCAAGLALAYLFWLYATNEITAVMVVVVVVGAAAAAALVATAALVAEAGAAAGAGKPAFAGAVAAAAAVAAAGAGKPEFAGAVAGACAGALAGGFAAVIANNLLRDTLEALQRRLADLADLDAESGENCVQYLAWCESDPDLRAYQDAIGKMGRMPILLDYEHAEGWIKSAVARAAKARTSELAKDACTRLAGWTNEADPAR